MCRFYARNCPLRAIESHSWLLLLTPNRSIERGGADFEGHHIRLHWSGLGDDGARFVRSPDRSCVNVSTAAAAGAAARGEPEKTAETFAVGVWVATCIGGRPGQAEGKGGRRAVGSLPSELLTHSDVQDDECVNVCSYKKEHTDSQGQKTTTGCEIRIQFYSLDCCSKEENCFAVCKSSFCSTRQRTFFYTTSQVLCELLIQITPSFLSLGPTFSGARHKDSAELYAVESLLNQPLNFDL